jgi:hypothetical protein
LIGLLYCVFETTTVPARGTLAQCLHFFVVLPAAVVFQLALTIFIADATFLCYKCVRYICDSCPGLAWPDKLVAKENDNRTKRIEGRDKQEKNLIQQAVKEAVPAWLCINLVSKITSPVTAMITYPFWVLLLLIFAESSFFDNWGWEIPLVVTIGGGALTVITCAWMLRRAAKVAKRKSISRLDEAALPYLGLAEPGVKEHLQLLRNEMGELESEAFQPIHKHPLMKAVLLPAGGVGGVALIQLLLPYFQ